MTLKWTKEAPKALRPMTTEEAAVYVPLSDAEIDDALRRGMRAAEAARAAAGNMNPGSRVYGDGPIPTPDEGDG